MADEDPSASAAMVSVPREFVLRYWLRNLEEAGYSYTVGSTVDESSAVGYSADVKSIMHNAFASYTDPTCRPPSPQDLPADRDEIRKSRKKFLSIIDRKLGIRIPSDGLVNEYDGCGRVIRRVHSSGKVETFDYDANEVSTCVPSVEDGTPLESVFHFTDGERGRLVRKTACKNCSLFVGDPHGQRALTYEFEGDKGEERLVQVVDPRGDVYHYETDKGEERLVWSISLSTKSVTTYDGSAGGEARRVCRICPDGAVHDFVHGDWVPRQLPPAEPCDADEPDCCAVCLEPVNVLASDAARCCKTLVCGHIYHTECIDEWAAACAGQDRSLSCPQCRYGSTDSPDARALTEEERQQQHWILEGLQLLNRHQADRLHRAAREGRDLEQHARDELRRGQLAAERATPEQRHLRAERRAAQRGAAVAASSRCESPSVDPARLRSIQPATAAAEEDDEEPPQAEEDAASSRCESPSVDPARLRSIQPATAAAEEDDEEPPQAEEDDDEPPQAEEKEAAAAEDDNDEPPQAEEEAEAAEQQQQQQEESEEEEAAPPAKRQKPSAEIVIHRDDDAPQSERSRAFNQFKKKFREPPPFEKKGEGGMHGWAIGMCKNGNGEAGGKEFKLHCLFAKALVLEGDVFFYEMKNGFRVLFSPAGLEAYDRCVQTITDEAMRAMRGKKANCDEPQLWAIQQLRDAGLTVCPLSGMPLADVGQPGRDALDVAFWKMLVDAVKAHETSASSVEREHAAASSKAYHEALEQAAKAMEEVEQPPEADDEGQPPEA